MTELGQCMIQKFGIFGHLFPSITDSFKGYLQNIQLVFYVYKDLKSKLVKIQIDRVCNSCLIFGLSGISRRDPFSLFISSCVSTAGGPYSCTLLHSLF